MAGVCSRRSGHATVDDCSRGSGRLAGAHAISEVPLLELATGKPGDFMVENQIELVRSLKGAPLSILFAMAMAGQAVGAKWLERKTGYGERLIEQGLLLLEEYGFVMRINRYKWSLADRVKQLPLIVSSYECGSRQNDDSQRTTATTAYSKEPVKVVAAAAESERSRQIDDSLKELHRAGIHRPTDEKLARLSHVSDARIYPGARGASQKGSHPDGAAGTPHALWGSRAIR